MRARGSFRLAAITISSIMVSGALLDNCPGLAANTTKAAHADGHNAAVKADDQSVSLRQLNDLIESGSFQNANLLASYLITKYPESIGIHLAYARLLRGTGKNDEAMKEYRKVNTLDASLIEPLLAMGELSLENLDIANGLRYARSALQVNAESPYARNLLVSALLQSDRLVEAQKELDLALKKNDRNPAAWHLASQIQAKRGDFRAARKYLESAVSLNPSQTEWTLELCRILENSGDSASARTYLEHVISRKPDAIDARLRLARNYEFFAHDYKSATDLYQKTLGIDPSNAQATAGIERCNAKKNNIALRIKQSLQSFIKGDAR